MRWALLLVAAAGVALAQKATSSTTGITQPFGVPPSGLSAGVKLTGAAYAQCSVHGVNSTFTGGSVCWYRNPNEQAGTASTITGADAGWEHIGSARQTASNVTEPDGGAVRRYSFPALKVGFPYGRLVCIGCPLTGTADDAGVAAFNVRTEVWTQ